MVEPGSFGRFVGELLGGYLIVSQPTTVRIWPDMFYWVCFEALRNPTEPLISDFQQTYPVLPITSLGQRRYLLGGA